MSRPVAEFSRDWSEAAEDAERRSREIEREMQRSRLKFGRVRR